MAASTTYRHAQLSTCGVPIESLLGYGYVAHVRPDDVSHKLRLWKAARETGSPFEAAYRLAVSGTYRWQLTRALPNRDGSGAITKCTDPSWTWTTNGEPKTLREADRRKDEFLAMLAHELRNPLAPICHALTVQSRSEDPEVWTEMRQTMERQVQHLVRLVDDLLDVSRLTMGRITLRQEPVDVRDIVSDALETCREAIQAKEHHVTSRVPSEALVVDGDRIRLVQILTNILNNAVKFTEPGGEIDIAASRSGDVVEICLRDSGAGISAERLPQIFDLFPEPLPDRAHGGLGVGLTLARRLVDMHAGEPTASSAGSGRGSDFRLTLPALTTTSIRQTASSPQPAAPARNL